MKRYLTIFAFALALVSCADSSELEKRINPVGFKGLFSDSGASWNKGDAIYITNGSAEGTYSAVASGASSEFMKQSGADLTDGPFTAYFPAEAKDGFKPEPLQNGKKLETVSYKATSSNTILLFKPMIGYLALDIDCQGQEIAGISLVSKDFRHEVVPAPDAAAPYFAALLPGTYSGLSLIVRTTNERVFTLDVTSSVTIEAGEETTLKFSVAGCHEQDAILADGPAVNAALRSKAPDMEKLVIAAGSESISSCELQNQLSISPVYFTYDETSKTGTISTIAPVIRTGTDLSSLFAGLDKLQSIDGLRSISTERAERFSSMFRGCASLEHIDLSGFNTAKATVADSMFFGCSSLKELDCSTFDVRKVTGMRAMFAYCSSLEALNIDNLETYSMTDGSYMFYRCTSLKDLSAAGLYSLNLVQNCSAMFNGDINLERIFLGANFYGAEYDLEENLACSKDTPYEERLASKAGKLDIYCARSVAKALAKSSLRWVNSGFEGAEPIPVTFYQDRFGLEGPSYDLITGVVWASDIPDSYLPDGKELNLATKSFVNNATVSSTTTNAAAVKAIEFRTNVDMSTITSGADVSLFGDGMIVATFSNGVLVYNTSCDNFIATASLDYMFDSYKNVKTITGLDKINIDNVTSASYMFNECNSLESLDLSSFTFQNDMESLKYMFYNCSSLKTLDISNFTRVSATGIQYMLCGTVSLRTLRMDNFPSKWSYASYNQNFQGESAETMIGASATSSDPCEIWTKIAASLQLMIKDQTYATDWTHSREMRKQYVDGKIRFRYPNRNDPWNVVCTEDAFTSAAIPSK